MDLIYWAIMTKKGPKVVATVGMPINPYLVSKLRNIELFLLALQILSEEPFLQTGIVQNQMKTKDVKSMFLSVVLAELKTQNLRDFIIL